MKRTVLASSLWLFVLGTSLGSDLSIGPRGINSAGLGLTGLGVDIGQVEPGRPGSATIDLPAMRHNAVTPAGVFRRDGAANTADVSLHAEQVAGIMISQDAGMLAGVAPNALLYSSAYVTGGTAGYADALIATQHVAMQGAVAINHSWGKPSLPGTDLDGNSLLTAGMDWMASRYNVLQIVAGNEGGGIPLPTDNFNGMTIAMSERMPMQTGKWRRVSNINTFNEDAEGDRTSISLIAPGEGIELTALNSMPTPQPLPSGTSYAAPHVTGTVALLREHAENELLNLGPHWNFNARRHEVMKAVLMNSADKLEDNGTLFGQGALLGMERTVLKRDGTTWLDSNAFDKSYPEGTGVSVPLDLEMGTGHLNARRALQQFAQGEHDSAVDDGDVVPTIGWDYGQTIGATSFTEYVIDRPLRAGSFISITVAWDRLVTFENDTGTMNHYDVLDTFEPYTVTNADDVINDLDVYLLHKDAFSFSESIAYSFGPTNIEHLFFQIPTTGEYKFWIRQEDGDVPGGQNYAVAWWAAGAPPAVAGDFDGDGDVDGADFVAWQTNFPTASGATLADGDADGDGDVDGADFVVWQTNFPTSPGAGTAPVPEPASCLLFALGGLWAWRRADRSARSSRSCPDGD